MGNDHEWVDTYVNDTYMNLPVSGFDHDQSYNEIKVERDFNMQPPGGREFLTHC